MIRPRNVLALAVVTLAFLPAEAGAVPAFARKYGTSCETCHTVYPKLTPFGEAFRRNGFRFPGVDGDYAKQATVPMGNEQQKKVFPNAVYPGDLPSSIPIAIGFNGAATVHPDAASSAAKADGKTGVTLNGLVGEAHVWMGGSYDDTITYFGEVTAADGGAEVEHAQVDFNDLVGPKHAVNLAVGLFQPALSSFGPHSSYVGDMGMTIVPATGLFGATSDSFDVVDAHTGAEASGVLASGRLDWAAGVEGGTNASVRPTENAYAHVGYKIGGMRLDGEGTTGPQDTKKPWAENAVTIDLFAYHSNSQFLNADPTPAAVQDVAMTIGGGVRAQYGSLELNAGAFSESHSHALGDGTKATALAQYDELSYIVYPWLVPAVRVEYVTLKPSGISAVNDLRIEPGVAMLIRPNLKVTVAGQLESAKGAPDAGWGPIGGFATPATATSTVKTEFEAINIGLATAF